MGVNADLLLGEIRAKGLTQEELAQVLNMSSNAFWRKIHGKNEFLRREIVVIEKTLELTLSRSREIFFPETLE